MQDTPLGPPPQTPPQTPPPPSGGGQYQSPNRTIMLVLSYLGILALIPLLVEKEDPEVQWHAKHGIILAVAWIVLWIAVTIISAVLSFAGIGAVLGCLLSLVIPIAILVIHILCIVKAINGEKFRLPVISDFADQWK
jgi:uncharacterized membrane protein